MSVKKGWGTKIDLVPKDVLSTLEELGINVIRVTYNEAWALCPGHYSMLGRHNNKPNKWSINIDTGIHSCFSCGFSGSFVTLVQEVNNYERSDAEQWTRRHGGVARLDRRMGISAPRIERDSGVREWNEARLALFTDPPASARDGRRISAGSVEHYGILWSDGDDPFWVLPIRDPYSGKLWGYQEKSETGWVSNKPYRVPKAETLFGIEVFDSPYVIVQESPLDCAVLRTAGLPGAVSTFGVQISDIQLELLFDLDVPVYFGFDNDEAGIKQSLKLKERYLRSGHPIRFLNYSHILDKKDLGSTGVTTSDTQKAFAEAYTMVRYRPCL